jgi:hypothetical protein
MDLVGMTLVDIIDKLTMHDNLYLILKQHHLYFFQKGEIPASASIDAYGFLLKHY